MSIRYRIGTKPFNPFLLDLQVSAIIILTMSIQTNITIEDLTERDLITPCSDQTFELTPELSREIEKMEKNTAKNHSIVQNSSILSELVDICSEDMLFLKKFITIARRADDLSFESQVTLVFILDQFINPQLKYDGVPEAFIPVRGKHLQTAIKLHPQSVVYAWRHNCSSCDTMKETLDEVFGSSSSNIGLFAVYGTNCAALLQEEFDIKGAPTTLFCANGEIDSRLMGAQYAQSIESEVEMIEQQSRSTIDTRVIDS